MAKVQASTKYLPISHSLQSLNSSSSSLFDDEEPNEKTSQAESFALQIFFWGLCGIDDKLLTNSEEYRTYPKRPFVEEYATQVAGFACYQRCGNLCFRGSAQELLDYVMVFNEANRGSSKIFIFEMREKGPYKTRANVGVYGDSFDECYAILFQLMQ